MNRSYLANLMSMAPSSHAGVETGASESGRVEPDGGPTGSRDIEYSGLRSQFTVTPALLSYSRPPSFSASLFTSLRSTLRPLLDWRLPRAEKRKDFFHSFRTHAHTQSCGILSCLSLSLCPLAEWLEEEGSSVARLSEMSDFV